MSTMLPVLHGAARAISPAEFVEALYAISPPRFPSARGMRSRSVTLAVSGGVDSMALAYLCSQVRRMDAWLKFADHPIKQFTATIVDHGLRPDSAQEAQAVVKVLRHRFDMHANIRKIRWDQELGEKFDMDSLSKLPNIESLARRMRYRLLGKYAGQQDVTSILLAHHEDDQYETVFMRLLTGHGIRGLRGIKPATDIPECSDMHGVSQSGFLDDLKRLNPMYSVGISRRQRKYLKLAMRAEIDPAVMAREMHQGLWPDGMENHPYLYGYVDRRSRGRWAPPLEPVDIEDGGVKIYRPLLGFSKERLIATCLQNDVPWFEDVTNTDPTLTMRNAVRHLVREHELPEALRKPAVLRLAERCRSRVADEDAEAERLLGRVTVHKFEPNVGSLVVKLPEVKMPGVPRRSTEVRRERKRMHYTRIASLVVQKLLALVTPEQQLTPMKDLAWVAERMFPSLSGKEVGEPKAFTICGVHCVPLPGQSLTWYLSRAPHASQQPRPVIQIHKQIYTRRWRTTPGKWLFSRWSNWGLFDNRYWFSLRCRVPFDVTVAPFELEHAKAFRETMTPKGREVLDAALRKYAPGKVRYTLPAIYVRGDINALIRGEEDWKIHEVILQGRDNLDKELEPCVELGDGRRQWLQRSFPKVTRLRPPVLKRNAWSREEMKHILDEKVRLVALPTLGIGIPGIESWVEWRFRYRKVELGTLAVAMSGRHARKQMMRDRAKVVGGKMRKNSRRRRK